MTTSISGIDDGSTGYGVQGSTDKPLFANQWTAGVRGVSTTTFGMYAKSQTGVGLYATTAATNGSYAVWAEHTGNGDGAAVFGIFNQGTGVSGSGVVGVHGSSYTGGGAVTGTGVLGTGELGVSGTSPSGTGVMGTNGAGSSITIGFGGGVRGDSDNGWGVIGTSATYDGVRGENNGNGAAIHGVCHSVGGKAGLFDGSLQVNGTTQFSGTVNSSAEIIAHVNTGDGVAGWTNDGSKSGVVALNSNNGHGLYAKSGGFAGYFDGNVQANGNVQVSGDVTATNVNVSGDIFLTGADCAERFDVAVGLDVAPGTVVSMGADGILRPSDRAYDPSVVGIVSGAGAFRPGITLGCRSDTSVEAHSKVSVALIGRAFCHVTDEAGRVRVGDLLTTSSRPGVAMRAERSSASMGCILGKALADAVEADMLIPVLVAPQ